MDRAASKRLLGQLQYVIYSLYRMYPVSVGPHRAYFRRRKFTHTEKCVHCTRMSRKYSHL